MSNDAADCLSQTPRAERSAISAGVPFSTSGSFATGSFFTSFHKIEARSPTASRISLCRSVTSPPFLQKSACCKSKPCWHPSHLEKERLSGFLYLTHSGSLNSVAYESKLSFNKGSEVSHKEQLLSIILQIARFWSAGKTASSSSSLSLSTAFCFSSWFFLASLIFVLCRVWSKSSWRRSTIPSKTDWPVKPLDLENFSFVDFLAFFYLWISVSSAFKITTMFPENLWR